MIEAVMYFTLGLLTAGLCALMVAPAVWHRAVRLTRARIERSVPITLAEIQADKDQLRAEFAMSTRRLEMTVDRLKEKAAEQIIEINRNRDLIARLTHEHSGKLDVVTALEQREAELRDQLRGREEGLARATADLSALEARLAERNQVLKQLEARLEQADLNREEQTVELVARSTEIDNLRDEIAAAKADRAALAAERATYESQISELRGLLAEERRNGEVLKARMARLEADAADRGAAVTQRDSQVDELRRRLAAAEGLRNEAEARLAELESARLEAEAQIARLAAQLQTESRAAFGDTMQKTIAGIQDEKAALATRLTALGEQRDQLLAENAELRRLAGEDWETERMENALLRERLNDIATKVARLTKAVVPGDAETVGAQQRPVAADAEGEPTAAARSLADRMRALQRPSATS